MAPDAATKLAGECGAQPGAWLSLEIIARRSFTAARAEASTSRALAAGDWWDYLSGRLATADTDPGGHRPGSSPCSQGPEGVAVRTAPPPRRIMQAAWQLVSPSAALRLRLGLVTR